MAEKKLVERDVCKALTKRWDILGYLHRRIEYIGTRGATDYVVMGFNWQGHDRYAFGVGIELAWVEAKAPGQKPEPHQEREHERLRRNGQVVLVIDSLEAIDRHFPLGKK